MPRLRPSGASMRLADDPLHSPLPRITPITQTQTLPRTRSNMRETPQTTERAHSQQPPRQQHGPPQNHNNQPFARRSQQQRHTVIGVAGLGAVRDLLFNEDGEGSGRRVSRVDWIRVHTWSSVRTACVQSVLPFGPGPPSGFPSLAPRNPNLLSSLTLTLLSRRRRGASRRR